jgi:hypothetical protein
MTIDQSSQLRDSAGVDITTVIAKDGFARLKQSLEITSLRS